MLHCSFSQIEVLTISFFRTKKVQSKREKINASRQRSFKARVKGVWRRQELQRWINAPARGRGSEQKHCRPIDRHSLKVETDIFSVGRTPGKKWAPVEKTCRDVIQRASRCRPGPSPGWKLPSKQELKRGQSRTSDVHTEGSMQTDAAGGDRTHIPDSGSVFGSSAASILSSISRYRLFLPWPSHSTNSAASPSCWLCVSVLLASLLAPLQAFFSSVSTSLLRQNQ